jgi:hypothetical protein
MRQATLRHMLAHLHCTPPPGTLRGARTVVSHMAIPSVQLYHTKRVTDTAGAPQVTRLPHVFLRPKSMREQLEQMFTIYKEPLPCYLYFPVTSFN